MPDYSKSKIYQIISPSEPSIVYYGSTTTSLVRRMAQHKCEFARNKRWCSSFEVFKNGDALILLVEEFECKTREELNKKEGEYILNNNCVNKQIAGLTPSRYYELNKEKIKAKSMLYYETNKNKALETAKKYRESNKETIRKKEQEYNSKKAICEICQKEMRRDSLLRHHKKFHTV
jgi:hypothetical protein